MKKSAPEPLLRTSFVGRADLARVGWSADETLLSATARLLEYGAAPVEGRRDVEENHRPESSLDPVELVEAEEWAPIPFWKLDRFETREAPTSSGTARPATALSSSAFRVLSSQLPLPPPLAPLARLWPVLLGSLCSSRPSRRLDVDEWLKRWSRGRPLDPIPFRPLAAWTPRLVVVRDHSHRLVPFRRDQRRMVQELRERLGDSAILEVEWRDDSPRPWWAAGKTYPEFPLWPGTPVLVLGDLGAYGVEADRQVWERVGQSLRREGVERLALLPVPANRWPGRLARLWNAVDWERPERGQRSVSLSSQDVLKHRVDRLLAMVASATRVDADLVRRLRALLPADQADSGTEADLWADPRFDGENFVAASVRSGARSALREAFASEPGELKAAVVEVLRASRNNLPEELWMEEVAALEATARLSSASLEPSEREKARGLFRLLATMAEGASRSEPAAEESLRGYVAELESDLPSEAYADTEIDECLSRVRKALWKGEGEPPLPPNVPPDQVRDPAVESSGSWILWQGHEGVGLVRKGREPTGGAALAELESSNGYLKVETSARVPVQPRPLGEGLLPEASASRITLRTDRSVVSLSRLQRESTPETAWAEAMGRDRFGLWASFRVGEVEQKMRWIPAGSFWMGSPEDEPGRFRDEGPRHREQIAEGFWLADTPCTQALWLEIMETSPSRFEGARRPVEQVSWEDVHAFCERLGTLVPDLAPRLPMEEEWEYACRAGTETATYAGPMEIVDGTRADVLEEIAWYGKNAGGETHDVAVKRPNPWGLFDVLGNVFEWCSDPWRRDYSERVAEEVLAGTERVIRGGSWLSLARLVRAAYRDAPVPSHRWGHLGFRLARGQTGRAEPAAGGP